MVAVMLTLSLSAKKNKSNDLSKVAAVYMYGLSSSFNDSTVYLTDLQLVDSAYFADKHILGGITEYVGQLNTYFTKKGFERRTNVVFFKKDGTKAEKAYVKLRRRYTSPDINLVTLGIDEFLFKAVRPDGNTSTPKPEKPKKDKKPKGAPDGKRPPMGGRPGGMGGGRM